MLIDVMIVLGECMSFVSFGKKIVDKYFIGGVGDKIMLLFVLLVVFFGVVVL